MRKYKFTKDGVPLISYLPPVNDQVPVPRNLNVDLCEATECDDVGLKSWNTTNLYEVDGATEEEILSRIDGVISVMRQWKEEAKTKGHEYVDITYDGDSFICIYYRPATIVEHVQIKRQAETEIKFLEQMHKGHMDNLKNAKEVLGIEDEKDE